MQFFKMKHAGSELSHMHEVSTGVDTQKPEHLAWAPGISVFFGAAGCVAPPRQLP